MLTKLRTAAVFSIALCLLLLTTIAPVVAQELQTGERVAALNAPATVLIIGEYKATFTYPYANYTIDRQGNFHFEAHPEKRVFSENLDPLGGG